MANKLKQKSLGKDSWKPKKSSKFFDMTEEKFWLMNHVPLVIAMVFKNHINSVHTPSTHCNIAENP